MKTFPSAFTKDPAANSVLGNSFKETLKNVGKNLLTNMIRTSLTGDTTTLADIGEDLDFQIQADKYGLLSVNNMRTTENMYVDYSPINPKRNLTTVSLLNTIDSQTATDEKIKYENPFKFPSEVLETVNHYTFMFKKSVQVILDTYTYSADPDKAEGLEYASVVSIGAAPSLFNPYNAVHIAGLQENVPLLNSNEQSQYNSKSNIATISDSIGGELMSENGPSNTVPNNETIQLSVKGISSFNSDDCSIKRLVTLSSDGNSSSDSETVSQNKRSKTLGWNTFRYADFMFCKDLGKVSNNHLIVLRKFNSPVGDNITRLSNFGTETLTGDTGKTSIYKAENVGAPAGQLVTWFGTEDNKLEDICRFEYHATYRDYQAKIEQQESKEDQPGGLASMINLMNPNYRSMVAAGRTGGQNKFLGWLTGKLSLPLVGKVMDNKGSYENDQTPWKMYDNNKVYEPIDTVQDNSIYEGKLKFSQQFTLTFSYKLRAYDNINPRAAMLDLIGNILETTYKRGKYWGGARSLVGPSQNTAGWSKAMGTIDKATGWMGNIMEKLINHPDAFDLGSMLAGVANFLVNTAKATVEGIKTAGKALTAGTAENTKLKSTLTKGIRIGTGMVNGMIKNRLGRPQMYCWQSIIGQQPTGFWHVTVGNPLKPILTMGNLRLENTTIQGLGPLGIDDFFTEIKVTCTLKHAKSRDIADISKMFTAGTAGIYFPLSAREFSNYFKPEFVAPLDPSSAALQM